jgi:hypothetical protein
VCTGNENVHGCLSKSELEALVMPSLISWIVCRLGVEAV